jgi:hypothetical protein
MASSLLIFSFAQIKKKGIGLALSFVNIAWTTTYVEILKRQRFGLILHTN